MTGSIWPFAVHTFHSLTLPLPRNMMGSLPRAGQRKHCWTCQQSRRLDLTPKTLSSGAPPGAERLCYLCVLGTHAAPGPLSSILVSWPSEPDSRGRPQFSRSHLWPPGSCPHSWLPLWGAPPLPPAGSSTTPRYTLFSPSSLFPTLPSQVVHNY